jgi:hypothetical protein
LVLIDRYTEYYVNQGVGGEIGPVYRASFSVQRRNRLGSFFRGLFRFGKPLFYLGAKAVRNEALKQVPILKTIFLIRSQNNCGQYFQYSF